MKHGALTLHWRHNGHDSVSNHQPYDCLLNCLFRRRSKIISKLRVTGLCVGNSPETGEFPAQMASNAENVSIWWRHHDHAWYYSDERQSTSNNYLNTVLLITWLRQIISGNDTDTLWWMCLFRPSHDDVIKWKHFPRYWLFVRGIHRSTVNSPHKGQWRGALMYSLICAWMNGWVNNCEAGDLRRHRAHYDVTAMGTHYVVLFKCSNGWNLTSAMSSPSL